MVDYKHPEVLVTTEWAAQHLNDAKVRFVEVDVDTSAYDQGHIVGAVGWNWQTQLQDNVRRDLIEKAALEKLLSDSGISNDTTIILYGDNNNWFAAYAFWQLKLNGHEDVRLLNGGRKKWAEEKRELTTATAIQRPSIQRPKRRRASAVKNNRSGPEVGINQEHFEALRKWRRAISRREDVSAFIIMYDSVLRDICATMPRTLSELARVHGIGDQKLRRYGKEILAVLHGNN